MGGNCANHIKTQEDRFQLLKWVRITLCLEWRYKINPVPVKMYRAEIKEGKGPC